MSFLKRFLWAFLFLFLSLFFVQSSRADLNTLIRLLKTNKANTASPNLKKVNSLPTSIIPQQKTYNVPQGAASIISISPAVIAGFCKQAEQACLASLIASGMQTPFPMDAIYRCVEEEQAHPMPECAQYRSSKIIKPLSSVQGAPVPLGIGRYDYAIICESPSCELKYYTDFNDFEEHPVWKADSSGCIEPTVPIPDEDDPAPARPCDPIAPDILPIAIDGEIVNMEFAGTLRGCIIPRVRGAYLPSNRDHFNRAQDYVEVVANNNSPIHRRECPGSYRVELRNHQVYHVPCFYLVGQALAGVDGNFSDDNSKVCYIGLEEPVRE